MSAVFLVHLSGCGDVRSETRCWDILNSVKSNREAGKIELAFKEITEISSCLDSVGAEKGMRYFYHLGWLHFEAGEYEKAIESYSKGLEYQPDYAFAFWKRGQAYEALGNVKKSVEDYTRAVRVGQETLPNFEKILEDYPDVKANLGPYVD